jgi:hypothetical protein
VEILNPTFPMPTNDPWISPDFRIYLETDGALQLAAVAIIETTSRFASACPVPRNASHGQTITK